MAQSLIQFAATGSPATREIKWPAWTPEAQRYIAFGESIRIEDMRPKAMDWLAQHPVVPKDAPVPGRTTRD
jgi:carboxylesterase type B